MIINRIRMTDIVVCTIAAILMLLCLIPFLHVVAVSFSNSALATAGKITFIPRGFTLVAYDYLLSQIVFWKAMFVSVERVLLGGSLNLLLTILIAYPLSKENKQLHLRTFYVWIFAFTMLFSGGLIPWYMLIHKLGLMDSIWALVLPSAVPVFNVIVLLNFFRQTPKELEESALIDGAGHLRILVSIYLPLALPSLATITLFSLVGHWNSWFDGLVLMNSPQNYPLQTYLQTVIVQMDTSRLSTLDAEQFALLSDKTIKAAQIIVGSLPIIMVYPFLQKYFVKGLVIGSVKG